MNRVFELLPELNLIGDHSLREGAARAWVRAWEMSKWGDLAQVPFSPKIGEKPSLVEHTRAVTRTVVGYVDRVNEDRKAEIDTDILVAAAILHDVCKVLESEPADGEPRKSQVGELITHGVMSGFLAWEQGLPLRLVHLLLTHTPQSKMAPRFLEGILLRHADLLDADFRYFSAGFQPIFS